MEVRRLRPSEGAAKAIVDVVTRVKHLETRPSGTIYVDETIISVDPETGREMHFGILPDGSVGFDPYVNDVTPPGKPSTPKVTATMGGLEVWWDGKEAGDSSQPDDYSHTDIEYSTDGIAWTLGGTFTNANSTVVGNLTVGTTYQIRLISYDKNKNASEPSTTASGVPVSYVDNEDVENALEELRQSDRENASAAAKAQESAGKAHETATSAGDAALKAAGIANGKGRVIYAPTAPTSADDRNANNLWVDTSGDVPKNTPYRWDATTNKWIAITDKAALDAGVRAGNAEQLANAASAAAAAAATAAGKAQTSANDKNRVWYLATPPAGNDHKVDDTWFDTSNGNMIHRWTGTEWVTAQDAAIAKADKKAADAAATAVAAGTSASNAATAAENAAKAAGAKGKVIIQNAAPDAADRLAQNLWIDTTNGANTPKRWNGQAWVAVTDKKATDAADAAVVAKSRADDAFNLATTAAQSAGQAQASADGKNRVWYSDTAPTGTGHRVGDTWFDASMDNMPKVWSGNAWISVQDKSIAKADKKAADAATAATAAGTSATNAQTAADNAAKAAGAKGKVIIQSSAPAAEDRLAQNLWIDTTGGKNTPKRWTGAEWAAVTDKVAQDAANAAATAQGRADDAFNKAVTAAESAGEAQKTADGKNRVWYSATKPTGTSHQLNDLWYDEANGNRPMRWNGSDWVTAQDASIAEAKREAVTANAAAATAQGSANTAASRASEAASAALAASNLAATKGKVLAQATAPTGVDANAQTLWIDTSGSPALNTPKRWVSGNTWAAVTDKAATDAATLATSKGKVIIQSAAPATADRLIQNLWIDTTNGANTPKRWNSTTTSWDKVTDKTATDAAAAAAKAQADATTAIDAAAAVAITAGQALTSANGKATVRYTGTMPSGTGYNVNDVWFDSANGNAPMRWDGEKWASIQDRAIDAAKQIAETAKTNAATAQTTADGKNAIYYQTSQPASTTAKPLKQGDMWFDTDDNYALHTYSGAAWVKTQDSAAVRQEVVTAAQAAADAQTAASTAQASATKAIADALAASNLAATKGKVLMQATAPTGVDANAQTLWIDTSGTPARNTPKRWVSGTTWTAVTDKAAVDAANAATAAQTRADEAFNSAVAAATAAGTAQTSANAKARVWYNATKPAGTGHAVNDLWFDSANGNRPMRWSGSDWVTAQDAAIAAAKSVADSALTSANGKNTTYYQTAKPTGGTYIVGDTWFDTDDNYALYTYAGNNVWTKTQDAAKALSDAKADATSKANAATAVATAAQTRADEAVAAATRAMAGAVNVVPDPNIDSTTVWAVSSNARYSFNTEEKYTGARSIQIAAAPGTASLGVGPYQIPVKPGDIWRVSAMQKTSADYNGTGNNGKLRVGAGDGSLVTAFAWKNSATWVENGGDVKIPANVTSINVGASADHTVGTLWVDDFVVSNVTAARAATAEAEQAKKDAAAATATAKAEAIAAAALDATTKANAAEKAAIEAASADATQKKEQAEANAATEASRVAIEKANAAQAAALEAAKTYADTQASGASGAALEAAKLDATNKANAAEKAAITAAALDATAKKEQAEAKAALDAKDKADEALRLAKLDADAKVATKTKTWIQTTRPALTGNIKGDTWIDSSTAGGNKLNVWDGSAWIAVQDAAIATAQGAATSALTAANGKNKIIFSASDASGTAGYTAGDMWMKRDSAGTIIGQWEFTTSWQKRTIGETVLGNLSAGKITSGTIAADRIGANSITASKILIGDFEEIIPNPYFHPQGEPVSTAFTVLPSTDPSVPAGAPYPNVLVITKRDNTPFPNFSNIPAKPGDEFLIEAWVAAAPTTTRNFSHYIYRMDTPTGSGTATSASAQAPTTTWVKKTWTYVTPATEARPYMRPFLQISRDAVHTDEQCTWFVTGWSVRRKTSGELIVDGAIKAGSAIIAEGAIGSAQIGDAQITSAKIKDASITNAKINDLNASKITAGTIAADRLDANDVRAKLITAPLINANDIIAKGSISSASGTIGELDASVITSGYISASRIEAGSLTIGVVAGLQTTVDAAATAKSTVDSWKGTDGKVNAANVTGTLNASVPGAKVTGTIPVAGVPAIPTSKVTNLDGTLATHTAAVTKVDGWTATGTTQINGGAIKADTITAAQIAAKSLTSESGVFGAINAADITTGKLRADIIDADIIRNKLITSELIEATDILVPGSITATNGIIGSLDAGKITAGAMDGLYIKANSIDVSKLLIGSIDNLAANPTLLDGGRGWNSLQGGTGSVFSKEIVYPGMSESMKLVQRAAGVSTTALYAAMPPKIPVNPGESFYVSTHVWATEVAPISSAGQRVYFYDASGTMLAKNSNLAAGDSPTTLPAGTWTELGGTVEVPADAVFMAPRATVYFAAGYTPTNAVFYMGNVKVYRAAGSTLITKGAVTTDHMTAGTIDGKIITGGTIKGTQIEAKTISTDNLLITSTDNLIQEADFGAKGIGWTDIPSANIIATGGRNGGPALRFTGSSGNQTVYNKYTAAVEPGAVYRLSADIKPSFAIAKGATSFVFMMVATPVSGSKTYHKVYAKEAIAAGTWGRVSGLVTVPLNTASAQFALELPTGVTSGTVDVDFASVARAMDGELVVDGSITTNSMKAGTIDGNRISANSISGTEIMAKTITVDNMLISSTDNFIHEADFSNKGTGWNTNAAWKITEGAGRTGGPAFVVTNTSGAQAIYNKPEDATPMEGGQNIRLSAWVKPSVATIANQVRLGVRVRPSGALVRVVWDKPIAANTWTRVHGTVMLPEDTGTVSFFIESNMSQGTLAWDYVSATRAAGAELIVDGSITTNSITSGGIDASVIKAGTLDAARIGAQSITAEKMVIGQGSNLISDPMFLSAESNAIRGSRSTGTWAFQTDTSTGIGSARTTTTGVDTRFHFGHYERSAANASKMIPAVPGEKYLVEASVYTNASLGVRWFFDLVYGDGTNALVTPMAYVTASGRRKLTHEFTIPAKVVAFQPVLQTNATGVLIVIDGGVTVAKKVEGNLIVDGALTGKKITGALIETLAATNRGIKLNDDGMVAYNNSGVETLRFSGNTATITGATVQTAATGARVIMDATGLKAYPATGSTPYLSATSAGLEVTGTLRTMGTSTGTPGTITSILGPTVWGLEANGQTTGGLGFYASALEKQQDSPPHIASLDGRAVTLNGMQRSSGNMAARLSVTDNYEVNIEGDLLVTGRVKSSMSAGMHWEWNKNGVPVPHNKNTGPGVPTFDADQSPVQSHPNKPNLYKTVLSFNSAGEMVFKESGTYLVDLKVAMTAPTKGVSWVAIQQYGYSSQIAYCPAGVLDMTVSGSFYFPEPNMKLTVVAKHDNGVTVDTNWRIKVTLLN